MSVRPKQPLASFWKLKSSTVKKMNVSAAMCFTKILLLEYYYRGWVLLLRRYKFRFISINLNVKISMRSINPTCKFCKFNRLLLRNIDKNTKVMQPLKSKCLKIKLYQGLFSIHSLYEELQLSNISKIPA